MNPYQALLNTIAAPVAAGYVAIELLKNPQATEAEIVPLVEGDLKHLLRTKLGGAGFLADIFFAFPQVDADIAQVVQTVYANQAALAAANPLTGLSTGETPPA